MARQGAGETHVVLISISMLRLTTANYCVDDRGGRADARADARTDALLFIRGDVRGDVLRGLLVARDFAANAFDVLRLDEHVGVVEIGDDEFRLRGGDVVEVEDVLFDRDIGGDHDAVHGGHHRGVVGARRRGVRTERRRRATLSSSTHCIHGDWI